MDFDLIKPAEAAEILLTTAGTLRNQRARREGPPYIRLPNGQIRYSRRALAEYIENSVVIPTGAA
jgi:hypothetical protein